MDFLHNSIGDFLNNMEIGLYKLSIMEQEIESIR